MEQKENEIKGKELFELSLTFTEVTKRNSSV